MRQLSTLFISVLLILFTTIAWPNGSSSIGSVSITLGLGFEVPENDFGIEVPFISPRPSGVVVEKPQSKELIGFQKLSEVEFKSFTSEMEKTNLGQIEGWQGGGSRFQHWVACSSHNECFLLLDLTAGNPLTEQLIRSLNHLSHEND